MVEENSPISNKRFFSDRPYLRLAAAWSLTCYVLLLGYLIYEFKKHGSVFYSYPLIDAIEFALIPVFALGMLSDSIHNCIMGRLPLATFLLIYAVVVPVFFTAFWITGRIGGRRSEPK